jgi:hypothetical protein
MRPLTTTAAIALDGIWRAMNTVLSADGMAGAALRFDAAEKRLVRACADDDGGGQSNPRDREQSGR